MFCLTRTLPQTRPEHLRRHPYTCGWRHEGLATRTLSGERAHTCRRSTSCQASALPYLAAQLALELARVAFTSERHHFLADAFPLSPSLSTRIIQDLAHFFCRAVRKQTGGQLIGGGGRFIIRGTRLGFLTSGDQWKKKHSRVPRVTLAAPYHHMSSAHVYLSRQVVSHVG